MEKMGMCRLKIAFMTVLLGVLFFRTPVMADVDKLNISQIVQKGNDVYLYVNALDDAGEPVADSFSPEQFSVSIDKGAPIPVQDLSIFESLSEGTSYIFCIDISKSVTEEEMAEIRDAISTFVGGMSDSDFAKIVTIGTEITAVCDSTQDKNALNTAIQGIERVADYTYLYKGLSFALDGQRKNIDVMPNRAAVILFTDGMDDSDGAASEEQVLLDLAETRIPVYVVGLKGQDSSANLNSVGQIARQSGGGVYSYNDMPIADAVQTIGNVMRSTCQLHIQPEEKNFGSSNLIWNVAYDSDGYSVSSPNYVYSLGLEGVVFASPETETETMPETEAPTEVITEPETELETEPETEPEPGGLAKLSEYVKENLILVSASGLILLALIILLVCLLFRGRKYKDEFEAEEYISEDEKTAGAVDETLAEEREDDGTIDELYAFDDEETVDGLSNSGIKLEFEITFDGRTETEVRVLKDQLILGRGSDCDVDVVLHSTIEDRKRTSRRHAYIIDRPDGLYVKDNSKNKTYLNGMEVTEESVLRDEDVLQLGKATVKVKILGF